MLSSPSWKPSTWRGPMRRTVKARPSPLSRGSKLTSRNIPRFPARYWVDTPPKMDDAKGMVLPSTGMLKTCVKSALSAAAALLAGCGGTMLPPVRQVKSPDGGEVVLTSAERAQAAPDERRQPQPRPVAPALFEQPVKEPPLEPLLKRFEAWTEQEAAADALGRIGPPAVPALVQALQTPEAAIRIKSCEVLGRMGEGAQDAVPDLVRLLDDPDAGVRKSAARTLGRIGPAAKDAVPALMRSLLQPTPQPPTSAVPAP